VFNFICPLGMDRKWERERLKGLKKKKRKDRNKRKVEKKERTWN